MEKDLEQLMDVPEYLFEHVAEEDCYLAKGSLVEYFFRNNNQFISGIEVDDVRATG